MKKKLKALSVLAAVALLFGVAAHADTTTSRFGLTKPDVGSTNWGPKLNTNSDTIDNAGGLTLSNSWTNTNTFTGLVTASTITVSSFTATAANITTLTPTTISGTITDTSTTTHNGSHTFSGANTLSGATTISGAATFSGGVTAETVTASTITRLNVSGAFVPAVGITGTTTNDSAGTGKVGEYISLAISASAPKNAVDSTYVSVATITLTAGDWDVSGVIGFNRSGATISRSLGAVSAYAGNTTTDHAQGDNEADGVPPTATYNSEATIPAWRVSISASAPYYLKCQQNFTGGPPNCFGRISARRVR